MTSSVTCSQYAKEKTISSDLKNVIINVSNFLKEKKREGILIYAWKS